MQLVTSNTININNNQIIFTPEITLKTIVIHYDNIDYISISCHEFLNYKLYFCLFIFKTLDCGTNHSYIPLSFNNRKDMSIILRYFFNNFPYINIIRNNVL